MSQGIGDAVLGRRIRQVAGEFDQAAPAATHGDANVGCFEHIEVIETVTKGKYSGLGQAQKGFDLFHPCRFAKAPGDDLAMVLVMDNQVKLVSEDGLYPVKSAVPVDQVAELVDPKGAGRAKICKQTRPTGVFRQEFMVKGRMGEGIEIDMVRAFEPEINPVFDEKIDDGS